MNEEEFQKHLNQIMHDQNKRSMPDFEGFSPDDMHLILYDTFEEASPLSLLKLSDEEYKKVPMLNQVKYIMDLVAKSGEIKLTNMGFLPTKIVADVYSQGLMKDMMIEKGISKLYKETDSITVQLPRILMDHGGVSKKRNGKLTLTKAGEKMMHDDSLLLKTILETFGQKFNWAYFDLYGQNPIGKLGYGFTLILLSKYGSEKRPTSFYAQKYFKAYPYLLNGMYPSYGTLESYSSDCYSVRTFDRFLELFGLVEMYGERIGTIQPKHTKKTEVFDKLFKVRGL